MHRKKKNRFTRRGKRRRENNEITGCKEARVKGLLRSEKRIGLPNKITTVKRKRKKRTKFPERPSTIRAAKKNVVIRKHKTEMNEVFQYHFFFDPVTTTEVAL